MNLRKLLMAIPGVCLLTTSVWALPEAINEKIPFVGSDAHGHAYPGATVPFGMVQLSPDTLVEGWDGFAGYHYSIGATAIVGFSHTHLCGTGCGGLGDILMMPTVGELYLEAGSPGHGYASKFTHQQEHATPGYYSVFLETPKIKAELTSTPRCGFHKYTFPASAQSHIILDLDHNIGNPTVEATVKVENKNTISGYRIGNGWGGKHAVYFVMEFSKPFDSFGIERNGERVATGVKDALGQKIKAFVNYKTTANEEVLVKVGISGTSIEGARKNLAAEIPGENFQKVRAAAAKQWKDLFDTVQIKTFDPHIETTFYANLYLSCQAPAIFNDVDGTYRGYDQKNHAGTNAGISFQNYTTFSLWDIYRAEWPMLILLQPHRINDMVQSLLTTPRENDQHNLPLWTYWGMETGCMIGYHSGDMISDAYSKGFRGFDAEAAYQALRDTLSKDQNGLDSYKKLGYVASKPHEQSVSRTLEFGINDWSAAHMAEALGHTDDAAMFYKRSANYYNLFDRSVHFFRGRLADGTWRTPFADNILVNDEYTEADAWQYAFALQQDVPGMISLYGGDKGFIEKMDAMFSASSFVHDSIPDLSGMIGQYAQGDEQCHHLAYLYDYAGAPYKTQYWARKVMSTLYDDTPAGECGNVDCGQMSAWYIFSALGFYPVNPTSGVYAIGSPVVSEAVIHLDPDKYQGRTFTVLAKNNSAENIYIQSATLNGKPWLKPWLTYQQITTGGTLSLVMGPKPNLEWGSAPANRPPATMPVGFKYPELPAPATTNLVSMSLPIRVICGKEVATEGFVPDPNLVQGSTGHSDAKIDTSAPNAAPAAIYQYERYARDFDFTFPVPKGGHYLVRLHFAELFDGDVANRLEDISINGQQKLSNFDIFAEAGSKNKAVVKDFSNIAPDAKGNIVIRISASEKSPDKNAKISGIEIMAE
jgi:predicted alpha-1,2-mannosidase